MTIERIGKMVRLVDGVSQIVHHVRCDRVLSVIDHAPLKRCLVSVEDGANKPATMLFVHAKAEDVLRVLAEAEEFGR